MVSYKGQSSVTSVLAIAIVTTAMLFSVPAYAVSPDIDGITDVVSTLSRTQKQKDLVDDLDNQQLSNTIEEKEAKQQAVLTGLFHDKIKKQNQELSITTFMRGISSMNPGLGLMISQTGLTLSDLHLQSLSGYGKVRGSTNIFSQTAIRSDAQIRALWDSKFCNSQSQNASKECADKKTLAVKENFIDFFLAERTWSASTIDDVLIIARRFFGGMPDKAMIGQGATDPASFVANQGALARVMLKMSVIDDLAARRAPAAVVNGEALDVILQILAPSGDITRAYYAEACLKPEDKATPPEVYKTPSEIYACNLTSVSNTLKDKDGKPKRVVSQAALDKIIQFDLMLSPLFYNQINGSEVSALGGMERLDVFIKAQQLAQDYRALRLLQMKVATTAMNMMNGK